MEPKECFWEVSLELYSEDEKGKVKKSREIHLVDAKDVTAVEDKVKQEMDGIMSDWKIKSIKRSQVVIAY